MSWVGDSSATVDDGAVIGEGTRLWHHVHVRAGARIGESCTLGKNVYVDTDVVLGDRVKVQNNVSIYRGVVIGDDVFLGPSCVFTNDRHPRADSPSWEVVPTTVLRGASVGANATLICGITIGERAMVGAGAVVTKDVGAHQLVLGNPARPSGWVCACGRVITHDLAMPASLVCDACAAK